MGSLLLLKKTMRCKVVNETRPSDPVCLLQENSMELSSSDYAQANFLYSSYLVCLEISVLF